MKVRNIRSMKNAQLEKAKLHTIEPLYIPFSLSLNNLTAQPLTLNSFKALLYSLSLTLFILISFPLYNISIKCLSVRQVWVMTSLINETTDRVEISYQLFVFLNNYLSNKGHPFVRSLKLKKQKYKGYLDVCARFSVLKDASAETKGYFLAGN